jgi:hypothetical protein
MGELVQGHRRDGCHIWWCSAWSPAEAEEVFDEEELVKALQA